MALMLIKYLASPRTLLSSHTLFHIEHWRQCFKLLNGCSNDHACMCACSNASLLKGFCLSTYLNLFVFLRLSWVTYRASIFSLSNCCMLGSLVVACFSATAGYCWHIIAPVWQAKVNTLSNISSINLTASFLIGIHSLTHVHMHIQVVDH